jgi:hypothetical protein
MGNFIYRFNLAKQIKGYFIYDKVNNRYMAINNKRWKNWGGCELIKSFAN